MKIIVISGSTRANSQTAKVSAVLISKLQKLGVEADLIDLHQAKLPIYDDTVLPQWQEMSAELASAHGFVCVVPEWNGTAGPGIMNLLTYVKQELAHKPVLLVSVSSGAGGSYPLAQIRAFGSKNSRAVFVPESLRFREVKKYFNNNEPDMDNESDIGLHNRSEYSLRVLVAYTESLLAIRKLELIDTKKYPTGF